MRTVERSVLSDTDSRAERDIWLPLPPNSLTNNFFYPLSRLQQFSLPPIFRPLIYCLFLILIMHFNWGSFKLKTTKRRNQLEGMPFKVAIFRGIYYLLYWVNKINWHHEAIITVHTPSCKCRAGILHASREDLLLSKINIFIIPANGMPFKVAILRGIYWGYFGVWL